MKSNSLLAGENAKNEKQAIIPIVVFLLIVIFFDYISILNSSPLDTYIKPTIFKSLGKLMYRWGEIIRALYVLSFSLLTYLAYSNKLIDKNILTHKFSRSTLLFLSILFSILFVECFRFPLVITKIIYPITAIIVSGSILLLMASLGEVIKEGEKVQELGVEKEIIETDYGFFIEAEDGKGGIGVNIKEPFTHVLITGGSGSGKTYSWLNPIILQLIEKHYSGIIYDVKYSTLGDIVYSSYLYYNQKTVGFYPVSFTDVSRSYRFNPFEPTLIKSAIYADEYAQCLYSNLDISVQKDGGGFFAQSAIAILKGLIWFLKKQHPQYCTLPHVIEIVSKGEDKFLLAMILSDPETCGFIKSVKQAWDNEALEQLSGQMGSLSTFISKLISKEIYWIFTGNDFTLDLNNSLNPNLMILGNALDVTNAMRPIISTIFTVAMKLMNTENQHHSVIAIDEFDTLYLPNFLETISTCRSNKMCMLDLIQGLAQFDAKYGADKRKSITANYAYSAFGRTNDPETSAYIGNLVGEDEIYETSFGKSGNSAESGESSGNSVNYNLKKKKILDSNILGKLKKGEFVGSLTESSIDFFRGQFKGINTEGFEIKKIPEFVENFVLNEFELKQLKETHDTLLEKPEYFKIKYGQINNLINSFNKKGESLKGDEFSSKSYKILFDASKHDKKEKILYENFMKIEKECKMLLESYSHLSTDIGAMK